MSDADLDNMAYWWFEELIKRVNGKNKSNSQDLLTMKKPNM